MLKNISSITIAIIVILSLILTACSTPQYRSVPQQEYPTINLSDTPSDTTGGLIVNEVNSISLAGLNGDLLLVGGNKNITFPSQLKTLDGLLSLDIAANTLIQNQNSSPVTYISVVPLSKHEVGGTFPTNWILISSYYYFNPDVLAFDPAISISYSYSESNLPLGISESDLFIGSLDRTKLYSAVDMSANVVRAKTDRLTGYGLFVEPKTPTLLISSPSSGTIVNQNSVTMSIQTGGINLKFEGGNNEFIQGRIIYYLDVQIPVTQGQSAITGVGSCRISANNSVIWENLEVGSHTLGVQLVNIDNLPFDPPVIGQITVIIK